MGTFDVAVIHATQLSIPPMTSAVRADFPAARLRHLLDDSLLGDLRAAGALTPALWARMGRLIDHLAADEVDAVQLACSGYAPVVDAARERLGLPVLKPDEAMYAQIVDGGHAHLGIAATVQPAVDLAAERVRALAAEEGLTLRVSTACRPGAMDAAQRDDDEALERLVVDAAQELAGQGVDAVALAQYSMSPVAQAVAAATGLPVYTGPRAAARHLRRLLE